MMRDNSDNSDEVKKAILLATLLEKEVCLLQGRAIFKTGKLINSFNIMQINYSLSHSDQAIKRLANNGNRLVGNLRTLALDLEYFTVRNNLTFENAQDNLNKYHDQFIEYYDQYTQLKTEMDELHEKINNINKPSSENSNSLNDEDKKISSDDTEKTSSVAEEKHSGCESESGDLSDFDFGSNEVFFQDDITIRNNPIHEDEAKLSSVEEEKQRDSESEPEDWSDFDFGDDESFFKDDTSTRNSPIPEDNKPVTRPPFICSQKDWYSAIYNYHPLSKHLKVGRHEVTPDKLSQHADKLKLFGSNRAKEIVKENILENPKQKF